MAHVFVGPHPDTLGSGAPLALDQIIEDVDLDDPYNQALITKGWLVAHDVPTPPKPARARAQPSTEGEAD
jgi:hypothetical protein